MGRRYSGHAVIPELQPSEELVANVYLRVSEKAEPFAFAASGDALYLPGKKLVVVSGDPYYFKRVPMSEIEVVKISPIRPYGVYFVALLLVSVALFVAHSLEVPGASISPRGIGYTAAALVGGLLIPIAAHGRYRLLIRHSGRWFRWDPPFVVDSGSKRKIHGVLDEIVRGCAAVSLRTVDERKREPAA